MEVPRADVVRHFLRLEASRPKFELRSQELLSWCKSPDEQLIRHAKRFADEREDTNPALLYTVGVRNDDRSDLVEQWHLEWIPSGQIYSSGISSEVRNDLDCIHGNIEDFAVRFAARHSEFLAFGRRPEGEMARLIVIAQKTHNRKGAYEIIDGVHRLVALCKSGVRRVEAFVGYPLKSPT